MCFCFFLSFGTMFLLLLQKATNAYAAYDDDMRKVPTIVQPGATATAQPGATADGQQNNALSVAPTEASILKAGSMTESARVGPLLTIATAPPLANIRFTKRKAEYVVTVVPNGVMAHRHAIMALFRVKVNRKQRGKEGNSAARNARKVKTGRSPNRRGR